MVWSPKATIQFANDLITASLVFDENSDTRAAIQGIANALISSAIENDPTLAANVAQAANTAVGDALANAKVVSATDGADPSDPDVVGAVGDEAGTPSRWLRFNAKGMPSRGALAALAEAGIMIAGPKVDQADPTAVGAIGDQLGSPSPWLRWTATGMPSPGAMRALGDAGIPSTATVTDPHDPDAVLAIGDSLGNPTWLRADAQGLPTPRVARIIWRMLHIYVGPTEPTFFPPGSHYLWFVFDWTTGEFLDIRKGVGI